MTTLTATDAGNQPMVRRSAHAWTVGVAMASPAALWAVAVPLLGAQNGDRPPPQVGLTAVVATAALASLVGWGLLAALECPLGRAGPCGRSRRSRC